MDKYIDIALIILLSIGVILLIVVLIYSVKSSKQNSNGSGVTLKEIGSLENQIKNLAEQNKSNVDVAMKGAALNLSEQNNKLSEINNEKLERFQASIAKQLDDKLSEINKKVEEKLSAGYKESNESIKGIIERIQKIDDAQKSLQELSSDVVSLKNVLQGNQTRGRYGEYQLSSILYNVFGDTTGLYEEQYTIKESRNGESVRADAVVFVKGPAEFICIDSKFPFADYDKMFYESNKEEQEKLKKEFANAVRKHITDIKNKYIIQGKTAEQAIMFIPNDGVFAFIHHDLFDVVEYARTSNVIITSPSTLQAILATINLLRINYERNQKVDEVSKELSKLAKQFNLFGDEWKKFSRNFKTAFTTSEDLDKRVSRINDRFVRIEGNNLEIEDIDEDED